jgi:hypothetical protein
VHRRALVVLLAALVAVFTAIAISVVRARDPIHPAVEASFDSSVVRLTTPRVAVTPLGCEKASLYFYDCAASLAIRGRLGTTMVRYRLWLKDDGCWTTRSRASIPLPARFKRPHGCIAD